MLSRTAGDIMNDSTSKESCSSTEEDWLAAAMGGIWITSDAEAPVEPSVTDPLSYAPFPNITTFHLIHFLYNEKSIPASVATKLVKDVFLQPEFEKSDLDNFNTERDLRRLDRHLAERATAKSTLPFESSDVWHKTELSIPMPCPNHKYASEDDVPQLKVPFWHRKLMPLIRELVKDEIFFQYHVKPHKLFVQKTESSQPMRVYRKVYTSNRAMRISREKQVNSKGLELLFIWLMFSSDATHLTNFGTASLWPIYIVPGNLSKYLPHLPDLIKDVYRAHYGQAPLEETQRFLNREVIQKAWGELLDEEFVEAFMNGLMLECADMEEHLGLLTLFCHSGDYPEKVNMVCMKHLGKCLCVRCLIEKALVGLLGTKQDMDHRINKLRKVTKDLLFTVNRSRKYIFESGLSVESTAVKRLLDHQSLTPNRNMFSEQLFKYSFDVFLLLVVDLLHEFELRVWKAVLMHLIRILVHFMCDTILDNRYRQTPTFGRSTIRRFDNNISQIKKLATRDFEDILQCAMACFEGLVEPQLLDRIILDLIFDLCHWHVLAKLRLHDDFISLKEVTASLGRSLRLFARTTKNIPTKELAKEVNQHGCQATKKASQSSSGKTAEETAAIATVAEKSKKSLGSQPRQFNLSTAKLHFLGDYADSIKEYGTTDSYSTLNIRVEVEHKFSKKKYTQTNKNQFESQMAQNEQRAREMTKINQKINKDKQGPHRALGVTKREPMLPSSPDQCFQMSNRTDYGIHVSDFYNKNDPALLNFVDTLKDYALNLMLGDEAKEEYTDGDQHKLTFKNNRIYQHKRLRINYPTYDLQRERDSINPQTHANIMTLNVEAKDTEEHPYCYGRVVGIYHATAVRRGDIKSHRKRKELHFQFLWVHWYDLDMSYSGGLKAKRLHRVHFLLAHHPDAFGFIDPREVLWSVHLLPCFNLGKDEIEDTLPPNSAARQMEVLNENREREREQDDWAYYYVNIHKELSGYLNKFEKDAGLDSQVLPEYDSDGEEMDSAPQSPVVEDEPDDDMELCKDNSDSESDSSDNESDDEDESEGNSSDDDEFDENGDPVSVNMTLPHGEL
uniref:Uncharacterized protein n=1 Tax=Moniliophthora roreri TaxID=221103 RepID=A0A0W0F6L2_MONRR